MALQGSGLITLQQIETEFGGINAIRMSEYYRGGAYVPDIAGNSTIATSGFTQMDDFYSTSGVTYDYEDADPCQNEGDWPAKTGADPTVQVATGVKSEYSGAGGFFGVNFKTSLGYTLDDNTKTYYIRIKTTKTNMLGVTIQVGSANTWDDVLSITTLTDAGTDNLLLDVAGHTKIYVQVRSESLSENNGDFFVINDYAIYYY
jgi:hypothetical protein